MIAHWFAPDEKTSIRPERLSEVSLWHKVTFLQDSDSLSSGDLLLISFDRLGAQRIKKNLYQFNTTPSSSLRIIDCGILIQNHLESVLPIIKEVIESGAMIIFLGAPMSFMRHQIAGLRMASIIRESNLDDDIHLRSENPCPSIQYIGTQRHLIAEVHPGMEGHLRLSDIKEDISLSEPCIRDSESLIFHCDSLCAADAGYITGMSSSGLSSIEACQLFRYAGAAQSLSTVGIYGYNSEADQSLMVANS